MSTQKIERRQISVTPDHTVELEQRAEGTGLPKIIGYSAVFGVDTEIQTFFGSFKERIQKGAFRRAIREGHDVRALRNHNPDNLLGRTTSKTLRLKEDDTGLWIEVDPPDTSIGKDTVESVRRGDLSGMSFAFIVRKEKWINGEDGSPDLRIIQDVDLYDVGPVTYPAYSETSADVRSASIAYQIGCAELGRPIPGLPAKREDVKETPEVIEPVATELEVIEPVATELEVTEGTTIEPKAADRNFASLLKKVRAQIGNNLVHIEMLKKKTS